LKFGKEVWEPECFRLQIREHNSDFLPGFVSENGRIEISLFLLQSGFLFVVIVGKEPELFEFQSRLPFNAFECREGDVFVRMFYGCPSLTHTIIFVNKR
jgi:hypothetical protein